MLFSVCCSVFGLQAFRCRLRSRPPGASYGGRDSVRPLRRAGEQKNNLLGVRPSRMKNVPA